MNNQTRCCSSSWPTFTEFEEIPCKKLFICSFRETMVTPKQRLRQLHHCILLRSLFGRKSANAFANFLTVLNYAWTSKESCLGQALPPPSLLSCPDRRMQNITPIILCVWVCVCGWVCVDN